MRPHPPSPSALPGFAAVAGGLAWSVVALGLLSQPVPPDWPGYLAESLAPAALAATLLLVAVVGAWLRAGDGGRLGVIAVDVAVAGHPAWVLVLLGTLAGLDYGPATAIAQTPAAAGTALGGAVLLRRGDGTMGTLLVVAACGFVVPSAWGWLADGLAWLAVGVASARRRPGRAAPGTTIA